MRKLSVVLLLLGWLIDLADVNQALPRGKAVPVDPQQLTKDA